MHTQQVATTQATDTRRNDILQALRAFLYQRPGLEYANYSSTSSYRSDYRGILQAKQDGETLLSAVTWRNSITADDLIHAARNAFSGRLTIEELGDRKVRIDYCTGQYFPTEYRNAVCAALASALWNWQRENMPAPTAHRVEAWGGGEISGKLGIHAACELLEAKGGRTYGHIVDLHAGLSPGDWLRRKFRNELGRGIASRWFR